jgi:hypothetical protein
MYVKRIVLLLFSACFLSQIMGQRTERITFEGRSKAGYLEIKGSNPVPQGGTLAITWASPNLDRLPDKRYRSDKDHLDIELKAISTSPLTDQDFVLYRNGKNLSATRMQNVRFWGKTFYARVPLEPGENRIQVKVENKAGRAESETLSVTYNAKKPNLHVLAIGTKTTLKYTVQDAEDFAAMYKTQAGNNRFFESVSIELLTGENATATLIKKQIRSTRLSFESSISPRDVLVVFIATHGFINKQGKLVLQGDDYERGYEEFCTVPFEVVQKELEQIHCKQLVFIDACHSGGAIDGARGASMGDVNQYLEDLNNIPKGQAILVSSQKSEYSYEDDAWKNGAFTEAIINGMGKGKADLDGNQIITVGEIRDYVKKEVPAMVKKVKKENQHPRLLRNELGEDTAIFIVN